MVNTGSTVQILCGMFADLRALYHPAPSRAALVLSAWLLSQPARKQLEILEYGRRMSEQRAQLSEAAGPSFRCLRPRLPCSVCLHCHPALPCPALHCIHACMFVCLHACMDGCEYLVMYVTVSQHVVCMYVCMYVGVGEGEVMTFCVSRYSMVRLVIGQEVVD